MDALWLRVKPRQTFAQRLGRTAHVSPLRMKLLDLWQRGPGNAQTLEEWLIDVANTRGARIIFREEFEGSFIAPTEQVLTNAQLVTGLLLLQNADSPQLLRLAAQLISRNAVDLKELATLAEQERVGFVLAELAKEVERVESDHPSWGVIKTRFANERPLSAPLIHWTRLAQPVMQNSRFNAASWVLVT